MSQRIGGRNSPTSVPGSFHGPARRTRFYGGFIGAAIAGFFYIRWKKMRCGKPPTCWRPASRWQRFGRVGCLLNGCCYGRPTNLPWGLTLPTRRHTNSPERRSTSPAPTEIYDALNLILYCFLAWLFGAKNSTAWFLRLICFAMPSLARWSNTSAAIIPISITTLAHAGAMDRVPILSPASRSRGALAREPKRE